MLNNDANAPAKRVGLLGRLRSWFFTGLLVTAPVLLTVYITWAAINLIDGQVASLVPGFSELRFANVPGVGLVIGVVLITVIGAVAAGFWGAGSSSWANPSLTGCLLSAASTGPASRFSRL